MCVCVCVCVCVWKERENGSSSELMYLYFECKRLALIEVSRRYIRHYLTNIFFFFFFLLNAVFSMVALKYYFSCIFPIQNLG